MDAHSTGRAPARPQGQAAQQAALQQRHQHQQHAQYAQQQPQAHTQQRQQLGSGSAQEWLRSAGVGSNGAGGAGAATMDAGLPTGHFGTNVGQVAPPGFNMKALLAQPPAQHGMGQAYAPAAGAYGFYGGAFAQPTMGGGMGAFGMPPPPPPGPPPTGHGAPHGHPHPPAQSHENAPTAR